MKKVTYLHETTEAWHTVMNYDPLIDSDDESQDEHVRLEYSETCLIQSAWT